VEGRAQATSGAWCNTCKAYRGQDDRECVSLIVAEFDERRILIDLLDDGSDLPRPIGVLEYRSTELSPAKASVRRHRYLRSLAYR
jgi:hypothetical protein